MSTTTPMTADQLLKMPDDGHRYELVEGELRKMSPGSWKHGRIIGRIHTRLGHYVETHDLGWVFGAETGFLIGRNPDTVRAPDVGFLTKSHLPLKDPDDAFWPGAPDLAVEVLSPGDSARETDDKVRSWLEAGTTVVWVIDARQDSVIVHDANLNQRTLTAADLLDGGELIPGFSVPVAEIFAR